MAHVARVGAEAGADIVKTVYTGDPESFREVVRKCPVPVVLAGGAKVDTDEAILKMADDVMEAGAMGVTFGRNVFQHSDPTLIVRALKRVVIDKSSVEEAMEVLSAAPPEKEIVLDVTERPRTWSACLEEAKAVGIKKVIIREPRPKSRVDGCATTGLRSTGRGRTTLPGSR